MPKHNTWVIKLGGSLIGSPDLSLWLAAIAHAGSSYRMIVVPGGGVFADVVRTAQKSLKFDDTVGHAMAIQGMRQFGTALAALCKPYCATKLTCLADIEVADVDNGVWIWDPCDPHLSGSGLPQDWRVTSDSLSLWLCGELDEARLLLVKSMTPTCAATDVSGLAAVNFVDEYFPVLWPQIDRRAWWLQRTQAHALAALLEGRQMRGNSIGSSRP